MDKSWTQNPPLPSTFSGSEIQEQNLNWELWSGIPTLNCDVFGFCFQKCLPGNPTIATIIGVFFQLGFKFRRCIDELDFVDSDPAPGEFKFGYFIFFSIRSLIG